MGSLETGNSVKKNPTEVKAFNGRYIENKPLFMLYTSFTLPLDNLNIAAIYTD